MTFEKLDPAERIFWRIIIAAMLVIVIYDWTTVKNNDYRLMQLEQVYDAHVAIGSKKANIISNQLELIYEVLLKLNRNIVNLNLEQNKIKKEVSQKEDK